MAVNGQRITDLPSTTELSNTDYIPADNDNQGTRKISYNSLSDETLNKLGTKTYTLNGASQTIPGAINTLGTRIDNIVAPSGDPTLTELADIRVNFLGETFNSAGDAVRTSDYIVSEYETMEITTTNSLKFSDNYGISVDSEWDAYSVSVSRYAEGKLIIIRNEPYDLGSLDVAAEKISEHCRHSNTKTPGENSTTTTSVPAVSGITDYWLANGFDYRILKTCTVSGEEFVRALYVLPINATHFGYEYLWICAQNEYAWDISWNPSTDDEFLERPLFVAYGHTKSVPNIDDTLTVSGDAADAKATGDAISAITASIPTVDDTLSITGKSADAKATGDAIDEVNERIDNLSSVPTEVKLAIYNLFNATAYAETELSEYLDTIDTWANNHATAISIPSTLALSGITSQTLTATLTPSDTTDPVTWTSSDTSVAEVTSGGVVSSIANGTCTITATAGSVSATCTVTVTGVVASYTVTNSLTSCTSSNATTRVSEGDSYTATITADSGYLLMDVVVTMGGDDVTSTVYSDGAITIASVTGAITVYGLASVITPVSVTWTRGNLSSTGGTNSQKWYGAYYSDIFSMSPNQTVVVYSTDANWTNNYTGSDGGGKTGPACGCCFYQGTLESPSYIYPVISITEEKSTLTFASDTSVKANYSKTIGARVCISNLVDYSNTMVVGIVDGV